MKKLICCVILTSLLAFKSYSQDMGLSFSFFFPNSGEFSTPVSPFSIRGLGIDINRFLAIETGGSIYRMSGMNIKEIPFESDKSLVGPFFSIMVPLELVIQADLGRHVFNLKGGGFGFINFATRLNEGNIDRELKEHLEWSLVNSDFDIKNKPGYGYLFGAEYIVYIRKDLGINLEAQYLMGSADLDMTGSYSGTPDDNSPVQTVSLDSEYNDAKLDYSGIEISVGLLFSP